MPVWTGTSGWQYSHWKGAFYPEDLPTTRWLPYYAERFCTVEVNNTFYRLPERKIFTGWRKATPDGFLVTIKASRYLTHLKRLKEPEPAVDKLLQAAGGLGDKLGPILLQLPPHFPAAPDRLDETLGAFPKSVRVAVEFRDPSWYVDDVRKILEKHDAAYCLVDRKGETLGPEWRTAPWGYLRLHEGNSTNWPRYTRGRLEHWAELLKASFESGGDVFVYFNNDQNGAAVEDARQFEEIAGEHGLEVRRAG